MGVRIRSVALALGVFVGAAVIDAGADGGSAARANLRQVVRLDLKTAEQLEAVRALGLELMSEAEGVGPVEYLVTPAAYAALDALGIHYTVLVPDFDALVAAERDLLAAAGTAGLRDPAWFAAYKPLEQIDAKLNQLAADRPDLASIVQAGSSIENRPIRGLRISGPGTGKPAVLYNGTQHAREWITPMVCMWIADRLVYGYESDPRIRSLLDRLEFYVFPVINPDGYVYSWTTNRNWRKNRRDNPNTTCDGVDLNRNWGLGWGGGGSSGSPCSDTYRGTAPFSEPETQGLRDFFSNHPQIVATIDFHSYSQLILWPWGYTSELPPDNDVFLELGAGMHDAIHAVHGMAYDYGPIYSTIYQASGGSVDWCYGAQGVWAFTIELRPASAAGGGFSLPPAEIIPTCEENFAAVLYLSEWSASPVKIAFPAGQPQRLTPNQAQSFPVRIRAVGAVLDPASPRLWTRLAGTSTWTAFPLTPQSGNLWTATLPPTPCGRTREYYISAATTAGTVGTAPGDAPTSWYGITAAPLVRLLYETLDVNPGWTAEPLWAWGQPTGGGGQYGNPDPTSGFTGANVYGYNLNGDYENNLPERHLTTPALNFTGISGATLTFYRWLGVEQPLYDRAYVRYSTNGTTWTNLWMNATQIADNAWVRMELPLPPATDNQPTVYLRWTMGTTDSSWRFCGWNIDDVEVWAADPNGCPPAPGDLNCDGAVNFDDIEPFVLALSGPEGYGGAYPNCDWLRADCNGDGVVDFDDIDAFVARIGS